MIAADVHTNAGNAIAVTGLTKRFGDVTASQGVSLSVAAGTIHGIVGENGAGKSTLLNMLFGLYRPDEGEISVSGTPVTFSSPADAMAVGLGMVHQHFMLVEPFTGLENLVLGLEAQSRFDDLKREVRERLTALMREHGFDVPIDVPVEQLTVGERQQIEILKALYGGAEILILDEPTAVLTPQESEQLFSLMQALKASGKTILFVTHKLNEIVGQTDTVTVIRAGQVVWTGATTDTTADQLAEHMVGARVGRTVERAAQMDHATLLTLDGVSVAPTHGRGGLHGVSLSVRAGEVLGIAGVAGNGQSELLSAITGLVPVTAGEIRFGTSLINAPGHRVDAGLLREMGMAHVAEDRLKEGAVADMTAEENAILGYHGRPDYRSGWQLDGRKIAKAARLFFDRQDVRPRNPALTLGAFSGGNQQKLVFAREMASDPLLMIIGQPTRGVDIGAALKIRDQITELRNWGTAILVVSADLDEILELADRVAVFSEGRVVGTLPVADADERSLGLMMAGQSADEGAEMHSTETSGGTA